MGARKGTYLDTNLPVAILTVGETRREEADREGIDRNGRGKDQFRLHDDTTRGLRHNTRLVQ